MSDTFWSELVDDGVNGTATIGALTPDGSPERAKKAIDLSRESGIPAPVIELNIERVDEDIAQQKRLQAVKESEGLQLYIQNDPMAAKVSSDDFDPLKRIYEDLVKWAEEDPVLQAMGEAFGTDPLGLNPDTVKFFQDVGLFKTTYRADPGAAVTEPIIRGVAGAFELIGRSLASGAAGAGAGVEVIFNDLNEALGGQPMGSPKQAGREMTNFVNFLLLRLGMERPFRAPPEKPTNKLEEYLKTAEELRPKPTRPNWHDVGEGGINTELLRLEHQAIKTEYEAATLDAAVKAATESKTRERSPEMFETFVRPATGDRTIVISAEAARDIYQERGVAPGPGDAVLGWIPDIAQKIQLELARGGDIQVPLSGYLAHIDPEVHKELLPSVRSPNGMSIEEVQAVQEEIETALKGKEAAAPTSQELALDESHYSGRNYYGQGVYTTDALDVSRGYAKQPRGEVDTRGQGVTYHGSRNKGAVSVVEPKRPLNVFDMEQPVPDWLAASITADTGGLADLAAQALEENPASVRELYDEIRDLSAGEGFNVDDVQEIFESFREQFEKQGFEGLSHIGGQRTKTAPHRVTIYFNPADVTTRPVPKGEAALAAPAAEAPVEALPEGLTVSKVRTEEDVFMLQPKGITTERGEADAGITYGTGTPGVLQIIGSYLPVSARGKGLGLELYRALADKAIREGLILQSDTFVSPEALTVYKKLEAEGYNVEYAPGFHIEPGDTSYSPGETDTFNVRILPTPKKEAPIAEASAPAAVILLRGEPGELTVAPVPRSHAGVFFLASGPEGEVAAAGYSRGLSGLETGNVRSIEIPGEVVSKLADFNNDEVYNSIVPEADRSTSVGSRGVLGDEELAEQLRAAGYTGYKIVRDSRGIPEYFILPEALEGLKYKEVEPQATADTAAKVRKALFLDPLFEEPKAAGMTDTEFKLYSEKVGRIFENDRLRDLKNLERIATRELTKEWKETLAEEIAKAETAFDARLDVRAEMFLTTGTLDPKIKTGEAIPLKASEVNKPNLKDMTSADGISPDDIAGLLGYTTGQEMLDALASLRDARGRKQLETFRREVTRAEAIPAAEARFGDFEARADAVAAGITDPDISKVLYDELRVMQKQGGGTPLTFEELLLRSQVYFNDYLTVTEASRTQSFVRKLIQAGRKAEMNLLKGKIPDAFKNKNEQLLAFFDMQQAVAFSKGLQKATRFIKKYTAKKPPGAVHPEYADQIQAILSSYGFPIRKPRFDLEQIPQLAEFLQDEIDLGFEIPMPEALLNGRIPKNWKEVTVAEFRDLMEALTSLDHVGRDKLLGIKAGEKMELKALQDEIIASVERGALRFSRDPGVRENIEHARLSIDAYLTRMAEFFNDLDGGDPQGPLMQSVYRTMLEAQHREIDVYFKNAIEHIGKLPRVKNSKVQIKSPFMNNISNRPYVFTKGDIVMLALNMGNKGNRSLVTGTLLPLAEGAYDTLEPFEIEIIEMARAEQVINFINLHMTEDDWKFVTGLWEFFTNLKPEIDHLYRELTGVAPDTVEPLPINTPFGVMPGGYSRIMHDPVASDITAVREKALFDHGHAKAVTPNRYTKKRTGAKKAFLVNGYYKMLPVEIRKMLHDLAFREALLNANKIFSADVRLAIKKHYGPEYEGLISPWLRDIANHYNEDDARLRWLVNLTKAMRSNITTVALGLNPLLWITPNISPTIMHPLDFQRYMQNVGANMKFVMENSVEVRDRMEMYDRDVGDFLRGQIGLAGPVERIRAAASRVGMYIAVKQDAILASARWWGEYQLALREGLTHEDAVFRGDLAVVRDHGSQTVMNLPIVMRGSEFVKTTTMFFGFLNTVYNRQRTIVKLGRSGMKKVGGGDYAGAKRDFLMAAANTFAWLFVVSAFGYAYNPTAFDGQDGEDDWGGGLMELLLGNLLAELPFVREISSFVFQDFSPRASTITTIGLQLFKSVEDLANFMADEDVSDRWLQHAINVPGYVIGLPTGPPARAVQYLWNVTTNQDDMEDFGDFLNGMLFGKSDPSKR